MNIQGVLNMHRRDKWTWIFIPSIILFSSFFINFLISFLISSEEAFYTGGVGSIFIYMLILGIMILVQSFPFAIGMSVRRTDFFFGTVLMGLINSSIFGILLSILAFIENTTYGWGDRFHFFHFPYLNDGSFLQQILLFFMIFTHLFFLGFIISSFARRYGGRGMLISSLAFLLVSSIVIILIHRFEAWGSIFQWFASQTALQLGFWLVPISLLYLIVSYFLLRKATI